MARIEGRDDASKRAPAYVLLARYAEWYGVLTKHKEYSLPQHKEQRADLKENMRLVVMMLEDLKGTIKTDYLVKLAQQREAERQQAEEHEQRRALAALQPSEPEPEREPEPAPTLQPLGKMSALRSLVGDVPAGSALQEPPAVNSTPKSVYAALGTAVAGAATAASATAIPLRLPDSSTTAAAAAAAAGAAPSTLALGNLPPAYGCAVAQPPAPAQSPPQDLPSYEEVAQPPGAELTPQRQPSQSQPEPPNHSPAQSPHQSPRQLPRPAQNPQQPSGPKFLFGPPNVQQSTAAEKVPSCDCGVNAAVRLWRKKDAKQGQRYFACASGKCQYQEFQIAAAAQAVAGHSQQRAPPPLTKGRQPSAAPGQPRSSAPAAPAAPAAGAMAVSAAASAADAVRPAQPRRLRHQRPTSATGLVGLTNLGNTCYMNSCLQCLSHTYELSQQCRALAKGDLNMAAPSKGHLATHFSHLVHRLWTQRNYRYTSVSLCR